MILTDEQILFIRTDIQSRGITLEGLQDDLVDHVCCLLEEQAEPVNFEKAYGEILQTFYKKELKEIETETVSLLNKKAIAMKKSMMITGIFSAGLLSLGIVLKFMYAPGAGAAIVGGTFLFSLLFLPLLALTRMKEKKASKEKLLIALGVSSAILMSISFVFRIQHWPGALVMLYLSIGILLLFFLPLYLAGGFKRPETKMQTLVVSIILVAGCGLWLSIVASPAGIRKDDTKNMEVYRRSEQILNIEKSQVEQLKSHAPVQNGARTMEKTLYNKCESLKTAILIFATDDTQANDQLRDMWLSNFFASQHVAQVLRIELSAAAVTYNKTQASTGGVNPIPELIFNEMTNERTVDALNSITQVQMILLQNEEEKISQLAD